MFMSCDFLQVPINYYLVFFKQLIDLFIYLLRQVKDTTTSTTLIASIVVEFSILGQ